MKTTEINRKKIILLIQSRGVGYALNYFFLCEDPSTSPFKEFFTNAMINLNRTLLHPVYTTLVIYSTIRNSIEGGFKSDGKEGGGARGR